MDNEAVFYKVLKDFIESEDNKKHSNTLLQHYGKTKEDLEEYESQLTPMDLGFLPAVEQAYIKEINSVLKNKNKTTTLSEKEKERLSKNKGKAKELVDKIKTSKKNDLVGKRVTGKTTDGKKFTGTVKKVTFSGTTITSTQTGNDVLLTRDIEVIGESGSEVIHPIVAYERLEKSAKTVFGEINSKLKLKLNDSDFYSSVFYHIQRVFNDGYVNDKYHNNMRAMVAVIMTNFLGNDIDMKAADKQYIKDRKDMKSQEFVDNMRNFFKKTYGFKFKTKKQTKKTKGKAKEADNRKVLRFKVGKDTVLYKEPARKSTKDNTGKARASTSSVEDPTSRIKTTANPTFYK